MNKSNKVQKTILIISTCTYKLHELEFVKPVETIIKLLQKTNKKSLKYTIISIFEKNIFDISFLKKFSHIIICGTALKDFKYLSSSFQELFFNLKMLQIPTFGICAGAQLICKYNNIALNENIKNQIITITSIQDEPTLEIFKNDHLEVYALHSYTIHKDSINSKLLVLPILVEKNDKTKIQLFKLNNYLGCFFHPEIKNKELIVNFIENY
ncbi:MAG: glutamine amidotransferase-related protein [Candidatus Woesearchaeota archaeon]